MAPVWWWVVGALVVIPVLALWVYTILDLVRRRDVSALHRTLWIVAVLALPLVGAVIYLIFRPTRPEDIRGFGRRRRSDRVDELLAANDDEPRDAG